MSQDTPYLMEQMINLEDTDEDYDTASGFQLAQTHTSNDTRLIRGYSALTDQPKAPRKTDVQARAPETETNDDEDLEQYLTEADDDEDLEEYLTDSVGSEEGIAFENRDWSNCVWDSDAIGGESSSEEGESAYDGDTEISPLDSESDDDSEADEETVDVSFEAFPPEIRNKIYHFALVDTNPILAVNDPTKANKCQLYSAQGGIRNHPSIKSLPRMPGFPVQLLRCNKAISIEAAKIFYGANSLVFWIGKAPVNHMDFFFGPTQCPYTNALQPRSTLPYMLNIKLIELADHDSLAQITKRFKEAAKQARKSGENMALQKLYIRKLAWKQDELVAELVPMLRALRKLKPEKSLEESGVIELVEFISWDKGASAKQKRQANDRNKLIRKALKTKSYQIEDDEGH
ncbi:uncharacterized protein MYCFIDRAFT_177401 [Pseudocercospora fijiensis CIRAD86]|uniref:Uncharacterized protein n=1 Tax=Pseudocercospora fijiensis (strain CIRAD86) TaxID=383855 RepID=M2YRU7_PSEFD|nr:uncharacterized protein MYCFIDRAFT_177401 [Pseudocercospora fijiensis CIRAD86]EME80460.1 hypothetical protein MYCFIDRAFT_177401 [Pseudocercospora fijiensis CIRAD86]